MLDLKWTTVFFFNNSINKSNFISIWSGQSNSEAAAALSRRGSPAALLRPRFWSLLHVPAGQFFGGGSGLQLDGQRGGVHVVAASRHAKQHGLQPHRSLRRCAVDGPTWAPHPPPPPNNPPGWISTLWRQSWIFFFFFFFFNIYLFLFLFFCFWWYLTTRAPPLIRTRRRLFLAPGSVNCRLLTDAKWRARVHFGT